MSTRISSCALLLTPLLLTACGGPLPDKPAEAKAEAHREAMLEAEGKVECAPPGARDFAYACTIDRVASQDGLFLTIRHPDGGFRRLLVTRDGRGVVAADGAERTEVQVIGPDRIEVAVANARYRLPATVRGSKPRVQ